MMAHWTCEHPRMGARSFRVPWAGRGWKPHPPVGGVPTLGDAASCRVGDWQGTGGTDASSVRGYKGGGWDVDGRGRPSPQCLSPETGDLDRTVNERSEA